MRSCPAVADRMGKIKRVSKRLGNDLKFPVALSRMVYEAFYSTQNRLISICLYGLDYHFQTLLNVGIEKRVFVVAGEAKRGKKTDERIHRSSLGHSASVRRVPVKCIYNGETFGFGMLRANRHNAPHFSLLGRHPILPRLSGDIVAGCICICIIRHRQ